MKHINRYGSLFLLFFALLLTFLLWKDILLAPNSYLFGSGGDGIKNYFTPLYHINHGEGLHFTGMNYPYGDHVVFTDNQPLLSAILGFIHRNIYPIGPYTVGIINLLLVLSIPVCCLFVFKILRHFHLPVWYATITALIIAFLSPQLHRFPAHFALGYTFFVPSVWWCLIKGQQKAIYSIFLTVYLFLASFIHVYYMAIGGIFVLAWHFVSSIKTQTGIKDKALHFSKGLLIALLPIIGFKLFLFFTDPIADRPNNPYGFLTYFAKFESVFLPVEGPYLEWLNAFVKIGRFQWEGVAYVGLIGLIAFILLLVRVTKKLLKRRSFYLGLPPDLAISLGVGFLVLLFAMALPFRLKLAFLVDYLGPLKQFRSLGRFAWVFYYIFTVYTAYYFYLLYKRMRQKGLVSFANWVLFFPLLIWASEAYMNNKKRLDFFKTQKVAHYFLNQKDNYTQWLVEAGKKPQDFQAILALPFTLEGSEKIYIGRSGDAVHHGFKAAYNTGLPLVGGLMSRTSLQQATKLAQLLANDLIEKQVLDDYPNKKPLLVLVYKGDLQADEQNIINKSTLLIDKKEVALYQLDISSLKTNPISEIHQRYQAARDTTKGQNIYLPDSSKNPLNYFRYYNNYASDQLSQSLGDFKIEAKEGPLDLINEALQNAPKGSYHFSFWVRANTQDAGMPFTHYYQYAPDGKEVDHIAINTKDISNYYQDWVQVGADFELKDPQNRIRIYLDGKAIEATSLVIIPTNTEWFIPLSQDDSRFIYNNYYFE